MIWKKKNLLVFGIVAIVLSISFVFAACFGFLYEGNCYGIGDELRINGSYYYVDMDGRLQPQKPDGESCSNNFECLNNLCTNGVCVDLYKEAKKKEEIIKDISEYNISFCGNGFCDLDYGEDFENCPEDCTIQKTFFLSIATLEDSYSVNEQIKLTDPPEEDLTNNRMIEDSRLDRASEVYSLNLGGEIIENSDYIANLEGNSIERDFLQSEQKIKTPEFKGYIVEFDKNPVVVEKKNLEETAEANEKYIEKHPIVSTLSGYRFFATRKIDVPDKVNRYKTGLIRDNGVIKNRIANTLSGRGDLNSANPVSDFFNRLTGKAVSEEIEISPDIVLSDFGGSIFNGVALDVSREEAEEIKKMSGVKSVSPNVKVETTLMDSIPLIQGGIAPGQLDEEGNDCTVSGKECLTGEGVTIGIIDTGVDYTNEDLGGSNKVDYFGSRISNINNRAVENSIAIYNDIVVWSSNDYFHRVYPDFMQYNSDLHLYNITSKKEFKITFDPTDVYGFSPRDELPSISNGKIVWYKDGNNNILDIYMCDLSGNPGDLNNWCNKTIPEGGGLKQITFNPKWQISPSIFEDKIVWIDFRYSDTLLSNSSIYMYDLNQNKEIQITRGDRYEGQPKIYGDKIVWTGSIIGPDGRSSKPNIYMYNLITNQEIKITNDGSFHYFPQIYKNKIVWSDDRNGPFNIYMYDINTGQERRISFGQHNQIVMDIYEDKIVWVDEKKGWYNQEIFLYDLTKNKEIQITCDNINSVTPQIFDDILVFFDDREENMSVYLYNISNLSDSCKIYDTFPNSKVIDGYDFSDRDNDPMDYDGHGTHVAATAAGNGVLKGVAPEAKIYALKVFPNSYANVIIEAVEYSIDLNKNGIPCENEDDYLDIISLSLGGSGNPDDAMSTAIDNAALCTVPVIAAGNSGPGSNTIASPGTARKAITVGATDKIDRIASFSSRGPVIWKDKEDVNYLIKPDIVAPGVSICASQYDNWLSEERCLDDKHIAISGTSMATPHVSGVVALLKQKNPDWTPEEIKMALRNTAVDIGEDINTQGYGRVDVKELIKLRNKPMIAEILDIMVNDNGLINVIGIAKGEDFEKYELSYRAIGDTDWNLVCIQYDLIDKKDLCSEFKLFDGVYEFMLKVYNKNGKFFRNYEVINLDKIKILNPQSKLVNNGNSQLTGQLLMSLQKNEHCSGADINRNNEVEQNDLKDFISNLVFGCYGLDPMYNLLIINALNGGTYSKCDVNNNYCDLLDINIDGFITSMDSLILINLMNSCGDRNEKIDSTSDLDGDGYLNTNDRKKLLDALKVYPIGSKECDSWTDVQTIVSQQVAIPANGLLKLDIGKDNLGNQVFAGFNNLDVKVSQSGNYRVYASFSKSGQSIESRWEFEVI